MFNISRKGVVMGKANAIGVLVFGIVVFALCISVSALEVGVKLNPNNPYSQTVNICVTDFGVADSVAISTSTDGNYGKFFGNFYAADPSSVNVSTETLYDINGYIGFTGDCASPDSEFYIFGDSTPYQTEVADYSGAIADKSQKIGSFSKFTAVWPGECWMDSAFVMPPDYFRAKPGIASRVDTIFQVNLCGDTTRFFKTYNETTWGYVTTPDSLQDTVWQAYTPKGMMWYDELDRQIPFDSVETFNVVAVAYKGGYEVDRKEIEVTIDWKLMSIQVSDFQPPTGYTGFVGFLKNDEEIRLQLFASDGTRISYYEVGLWSTLSALLPRVVHQASLDVNNDGLSDIALVVDDGLVGTIYRTSVHVLLNTGTAFSYAGIWWTSGNYNASNIVHAVGANWNGTGPEDLVFIFNNGLQSNGKYLTTAHVLVSTGTAFSYAGIWWTSGNYNASNIKFAQAGILNNDGLPDLVLVYWYSDLAMRFHVLPSSGNLFISPPSSGWLQLAGYPVDSILFLSAGNFNEQAIYGKAVVTGSECGMDEEITVPKEFVLSQNYPNPFNPTTVIEYQLPEAAHVELRIINILGQVVVTLVDADQAAGSYAILWNANAGDHEYASGIYFYQLRAGDQIKTKKMVLLK